MKSKDSKIYIAGHKGMVGSACWKILEKSGYTNLIGINSKKLDLSIQSDVFDFLNDEKPDAIIDAAAKVGGIYANNKYPYEFLLNNMLIQNNLISSAHNLNISKFIFLGSSCIYPRKSPQPIKEDYLLKNELENTNQWYAIAKISGVKLIESLRRQYSRDYVSLMPSNLYGPRDNFDLKSSHVIPALIRKIYEAKENNKEVNIWGTGSPRREFLFVDDLAYAIKFVLENRMKEHLYNVGYGSDISISELVNIIMKIINYNGKLIWDKDMPDGTPKKLMDSSKLNSMGWRKTIDLKEGITLTYNWFIENKKIF